jgi:cephalosporin-C deacetylase-like acetyl esterase
MYCSFTTVILILACLLPVSSIGAEPPKLDTTRGDKMIAEYFRLQTAELRDACLHDVDTLANWEAKRPEYRRQLLEMLGLDPLPERTELKATVTGSVEHDEFVVEKVYFQSRPGLYVTGNLYLPKEREGPAPAILYVCGHGPSKKDGISFGNKVSYQHHGGWFARNGYVCLTIDTLQMGEIEGIHHGTYRYDMWWWLNRGYTPAGVEAWNCVRALDYLQTRPEVDPERFGVTGRSGGGAYSWWIAAIDERIKAAVPVAGITDLENHVVDGCVEGHCDCMYMVNTYRWDYPLVAALVAPRPLLLSNTDRDGIFPLDGVVRTYGKAREIYELYGAADKLGLHLAAGPHKDTQQLRIGAFQWLNHHLKNDDSLIDKTAVKFFEPEPLRVFDDLPDDQRNTEIHETFVAAASDPPVPETADAWEQLRTAWRTALLKKSFRAWPQEATSLNVAPVFSAMQQGIQFDAFDFTSQESIRLRLYVVQAAESGKPEAVVLNVLDDAGWLAFLSTMRPAFEEQLNAEALPPADESAFGKMRDQLRTSKCCMAYVAPRGVGPAAWDQGKKKQTQNRRRFYLLGQTLDGMRIWDIRRAVQAVRSLPDMQDLPLRLRGQQTSAGLVLYASLFEPDIQRLDLYDLPTSHRNGPYLLNVRRYLDMPQAVAMAAERTQVVIHQQDLSETWDFPVSVVRQLEWDQERLQIEELDP